MNFPRFSSQTSLCQQSPPPPPPPQQTSSPSSSATAAVVVVPVPSNNSSRTPISQRVLSANPEPQFLQLPNSTHYQPSRRKEEARALQNLRRRVHQLRLNTGHAVVTATSSNASSSAPAAADRNANDLQLDNRPHLLQKILSNRPVSMVLDSSEIRTAWQDSDFITDSLCWHNVYRQRHNSPPLTMSSELCHLAQTWANHLAHTNRFYYRNDKDIGQNLFCRPDNALQNDVTGQEVSTYWYSAVKQYDYGKEPDVLHANVNAGHFTQLAWASSRHFGVGKARSRSGKIVVVAHYAPAGNISGAFQNNVLPPALEVLAAAPGPTPTTPLLQPPRFVISCESDTDDTNSTNQSQSTP
ncbi:PREDICTED: uncharacterized protein LOC108568221 [Nicrophorus vespilloides]|uniref:Uncharacterized protein LOC108568221 n=1 Tax=Nicrophorus vespilloides TaxID=110193 RepID=A0ABM1NCX0_NICVS|nr:PREDICTED: uncharacterized protein LOC108568221 [Nicrophorus vespilloides]